MYDNLDSNNSSIPIKKSLRRTIEKLKRSINLIDLIDESQAVDQNIIATLTENSELLLNYLQENKRSQTDKIDEDNSNQEQEKLEKTPKNFPNNINYGADSSINSSNYQVQKQQSNNQFILVIGIALIISLCFNIYFFFWSSTNLATVELNNNQEEKVIKPIETEAPKSKIEILDLDQSSEESETRENTIIGQDNLSTIETQEEPQISPEIIPDNESKISIPKPEIIPEPEDIEYKVQEQLPESIANQFLQIADDYGEDLIYLIIPNYKNNSMMIIVNQNWQEIDQKKQEEFSNELLRKAQSIDFYRFQIKDRKGRLLAREPAIGDRIILLQ